MNVKPARIYVLSAGGAVKVGRSSNVPRRCREIASARGEPVDLLYASDEIECSAFVEAKIHSELGQHRRTGEWFNAPPDLAVEVARKMSLQADGKRPPTLLAIRFNPELLDALDEFRLSLPYETTRTALIEAAVRKMLEAEAPPKKGRK